MPDLAKHLKGDVTIQDLERQARSKTDTAAAEKKMQKAKQVLFESFQQSKGMNRQAKTNYGAGVSTRTGQSIRNARQTAPILNESGARVKMNSGGGLRSTREGAICRENQLGLASRWSASLLIWCSETKDKTKTFQ